MSIRQSKTVLPVAFGVLLLSVMATHAGEWKSLFDGKTLGKWTVVKNFDFINHGKVEVKDGNLVLGKGGPGTAVRFTGKVPEIDYEIRLEAMRVVRPDRRIGGHAQRNAPTNRM